MLNGVFISALNHLLADAPWARQRLAVHRGQRARLEIGGGKLEFAIDAEGYACDCAGPGDHHVSILLPRPGLGELGQGIEAWIRQARIEGHVEMADALGFVFRNLRWDLEGELARMFGDVAAHRLHQAGTGLLQSGTQALRSGLDNVREFAAEGRLPVIARNEWLRRLDELRELRDALARLEKRVDRQTAPEGSSSMRPRP